MTNDTLDRDLPEHFTDTDSRVAGEYPNWPDKGAVVDGKRLTVMTAKSTYQLEEEIRVIHAFEATESGVEVFIMGPKTVYGEYLDGSLVTDPPPDERAPWIPQIYDGPVLEGPAVDFNYEITSYRLSEPDRHELVWRLGPLESNTLEIEVVEGTPGENA